MDKNRLHPELKKTFSRLPNMTITNKPKLWFFRILMNKMVRLGYKPDDQVEITEHKLSTCSIRIFTPKGVLSGGGLLWIHGGGLIMMSAKSSDADCEAYAKLHKVVVVSVDYRLAPEHPFPAANNDCFESWQWFLDNAEKLGVDQNRIAIGGQSAGGGLTAGLCQRILDHGGTQPCAQYLIYPMLDDRTATISTTSCGIIKVTDMAGSLFWPNKPEVLLPRNMRYLPDVKIYPDYHPLGSE